MPCRYLPVSRPRPSGDQASTPSPSASAAGTTSRSTPALQQRVLDLGADDRRAARPGALPGGGLRGLPAGEVADPDVAGAAGGDGRRRRRPASPRAAWRRPRRAAARGRRGRRRAAPARRRARPAGGRGTRRGPSRPGACGRRPWSRPATSVARDDVGQQVAEGPLALAVAVDVGGVDERAAGVDEGGELHRRLVLVGVPAPGHRAQPQPGHDQAAAPQRPLLHGGPTYRCPPARLRPATPTWGRRRPTPCPSPPAARACRP